MAQNVSPVWELLRDLERKLAGLMAASELETHAKLAQAYKARLSEYEEKLAALEMQAGVTIRDKNPALNLELMSDELKKNCITILTQQHYDLFDSRGAIRAFLRAGVRMGADDLDYLSLFLE